MPRKRLALDTIENRVFRCLWPHPRPLVTEINMAEHGSCCNQRELLVDKSHRNGRESIPWRSWSTVFIFRHIHFCHERTTMTSETSENTIFVRFYFTLFYLTLTSVSKRPCPTCHIIWSHTCCVSVKKGQWANKALNYQTKMLNSNLNKAITLMKVDQRNYDAKMTSKDRIQSSACPEFSRAVCTLFMPRICPLQVRLKIWLQFF